MKPNVKIRALLFESRIIDKGTRSAEFKIKRIIGGLIMKSWEFGLLELDLYSSLNHNYDVNVMLGASGGRVSSV